MRQGSSYLGLGLGQTEPNIGQKKRVFGRILNHGKNLFGKI